MGVKSGSDNIQGTPLRGLRILLVEDNALVAIDSQEALLEAAAKSVELASTPADGLRILATGGIDAAIVDVHLGQEGGLAVAEALAGTNIPFIFATGYSVSLTLPASMKLVPLVSKPYLATDLIDTLAAELQNPARLQAFTRDGG